MTESDIRKLLAPFADAIIDWEMTPELAVTLYLEWGNNDWRSDHPPVRSRDDVSLYFVVDAWQPWPELRLVRRSMTEAEDLLSFPLPEALARAFREEYGELKGLFEPLPAIKDWLRGLMG